MTFDVDTFVIAAFSVGGVCLFISLCALIFFLVYFKPYKKCCGGCCNDRRKLLEEVSDNGRDWADMPSTNSSFEMHSSMAAKFNGRKDAEATSNNKPHQLSGNLNDHKNGVKPQNPYVSSIYLVPELNGPKEPSIKEGKFVNEAFKFLDEF